MRVLMHSWFMTVRHLRNLARQPWWIAVTLVQPLIWLLLYGALFQRVTEIPGFGAHNYIYYLTPGIVVMSALFSSGWSGMGVIEDLDRGVMDRFLVSPVSRIAIIAGRLVFQAIVNVIQSTIIIVLGLVDGARFPGGLAGVVTLIVCTIFLGLAIGSLSTTLALLARRQETLIAVLNFLALPLIFLSGAFMQPNLAPRWIQSIARFNPVNWTVQSGRDALGANADWSYVLVRAGWLMLLAALCGWLATRAFRTYQRSV